jgi:hypothetical protein
MVLFFEKTIRHYVHIINSRKFNWRNLDTDTDRDRDVDVDMGRSRSEMKSTSSLLSSSST